MIDKGYYLYGFIAAAEEKNYGPIGICQNEVSFISFQNISAVVSHAEWIDFSALSKETLVENLMIHQSAIEIVMKDYCIVPAKFGTMIQEKNNIGKILAAGYDQIKQSFSAVDNKIELDVVAVWSDMGSILKKIGESEEVKQFKAYAQELPSEKIHDAQIALGKMIKIALDHKRYQCVSQIMELLAKESDKYKEHDIKDDTMVMNVAFLIKKNNQEAFESAVSNVDAQFNGNLNFRIVGPLPAYSFNTLEIQQIEFQEIDAARKIFGLDEETSRSEIKAAYRQRVKEAHPDRHPDDVNIQKRFEAINQSYNLLMDYCRSERCSFRETDVQQWAGVKPVDIYGRYK